MYICWYYVIVRVVDQLGGCGYTGGQTFWVDPRLDLELKVVLQVDLVRVVLGWGCTWLELYLVCILLVVVVLGQSFTWLQLQLILLAIVCTWLQLYWLELYLVRVILDFAWLQLYLVGVILHFTWLELYLVEVEQFALWLIVTIYCGVVVKKCYIHINI